MRTFCCRYCAMNLRRFSVNACISCLVMLSCDSSWTAQTPGQHTGATRRDSATHGAPLQPPACCQDQPQRWRTSWIGHRSWATTATHTHTATHTQPHTHSHTHTHTRTHTHTPTHTLVSMAHVPPASCKEKHHSLLRLCMQGSGEPVIHLQRLVQGRHQDVTT